MTPLVPIMMYGWIPLVLAMFCLMPARRAAVYAFVFAWMFLPVHGIPIRYLPDYDKITATCYAVLIGMLVLDTSGALFKLRLKMIDVPVIVWCFVPAASSITNGLGVYDAVSATMAQTITWGIPYLTGRVYCNDAKGIRELAMAIMIGGIIYVPLCLFEMRFAPVLHQMVYGKLAAYNLFAMSKRWGGWRPNVFMHHGLMVSIFMASATIVAVWLWRTGHLKRLWGVPMSWIAGVLLAVTVVCRSTGATGLLLLGLMLLMMSKYLRRTWPLIVLIAIPPAYCALRVLTPWEGEIVVPTISAVVGEGRASSLQYRIDNEVHLSRHAMTQPLFGWAGWNRSSRTPGDLKMQQRTQDSLWIIAVGKNGLVGLTALLASMLLPPLLILRRLGRYIDDVNWAPAVAIAILVVLYVVDCMVNAMVNPIFMLGVGGLAGLAAAMQGPNRVPRRQAVVPASAVPRTAVT